MVGAAEPAPQTPAAERHDPYAALRHRPFRLFIISLLAMTAASQVQEVVVAWQIYARTKDPLSLGLVGLAEAVPFISVAMYAGHVADRVDRRKLAVAALAALAACAVALLAIAVPFDRGRFEAVWPLYAVIFLTGIARSFLQPARTALTSQLVPRALYASATTWRSSTWQTAAVAGPALGGLLYAVGGATLAYAVVVLLMLAALATMTMVPSPGRVAAPAEGEGEGESMRDSLVGGLRFVVRQPVVLGAITLDLFAVLFGGATALLPLFADSILHVGPQGLGVLRAAPAAGAVLMSLVLAHRPPFRRAGVALLWNVAAFGLCMIGFGLSRNFALSVGLLALSGMVDNVSVVIRGTLIQVMTPAHLLGRVSAVNSIFIGSSNEIGAFESGVAAKLLGAVRAVVLGGIATLGVVGVIAWKLPEVRRLGQIR
ncbi:MAG TPA: MFS transporter [Gemmatimonadaceae bacterium]|nr:MFS transporter [Gemmatimonadaceae bacterium]